MKRLVGSMVFLLLGCINIVPIPTPTALPPTATPFQSPLPTPSAGLPARIVAEAIALDAPVVAMGWRVEEVRGHQVSVWRIPDDEAGWHQNSARPGQAGNMVISGHNNSTGGHVFGDLADLEIGDQITIWTDQQEAFTYQISRRDIIRAFGASTEELDYLQQIIQPTSRSRLTLITCWPNWTNTHRLILVAEPLQ